MCEHPIDEQCAHDPEQESAHDTAASPARIKLWAIPQRLHCSIIGTCLTREDLAQAMRRLGLSLAAGASDYDVHGWFVAQAAQPGPAGRLLHKQLDGKYAGEIRRFGREGSEHRLLALWRQAVETGNIAPAYWALLSRGGVPATVTTEAFGDVHMLSHLMGGENRQGLRARQAAERQGAEQAERLARAERQRADLTGRLQAQDRRLAELEAELARIRADQTSRPTPPPASTPDNYRLDGHRLADCRRRLTVERARARAAETENARLRAALDGLALQPAAATASPPFAVAAADSATGAPPAATLGGRAVLYVGGHPGTVPRLRSTVERLEGCLLHHDGGIEHAPRNLESLVERADLVFCPVDCVSHNACLRIKRLCRQMAKPFVPLRSSGASFFARALHAASR